MEEQLLGRKRMEQDTRRLRTYIPQLITPLQDTSLPYTSTSFDGDSFGTTAKTLIDLSATFGVPANVRAVILFVWCRDEGAVGNDTWVCLSPNNTANSGLFFSSMPVADRPGRYGGVTVPCDLNGDIYYQIAASGAGKFDLSIEVWGYYL